MNGQEIQKAIEVFESSKIYSDMKLYRDFYLKRNPALMNRVQERERKHKTPNWCVPTAYFSTVIDTHAGYLFSNIQYDCADGDYEDAVQKILDKNNISVKDMKAGLNALTYNRAYELIYTVGDGTSLKNTEIRIASLDPLSVIPIYSDDIEPKLTAIIWYRMNGDKYLADYISATEWQQFERTEKDKDYTLVNERKLWLSECPVVEYRSEMIGDASPFDGVISYIEALDWAITGNSNEIDRIVDAILMLGKKLPKDVELSEIKTLEDITKDELTPQFLEKNLSPEFRKYVTDLLIQEIYKHSHTVDWHTEMGGDASAKALKIRLFDMDMFSKRIEKVFMDGTRKRLELLGDLVKLKDNLQPEEMKITFERTLPTDVESLIQVLTGVDWISAQTKQEWVGLDAEVEASRLAESRPMIDLDLQSGDTVIESE
jgi:SPP1 family phage portal protein